MMEMTQMNEAGVVMLPLPFKRRDLVQYQGQEYQILKSLGKTADRVAYDARNTETFEVTRISIPYDFQHEDREPPKAEDNYFQILELNEESMEVTLRSFLTGKKRRIKVRIKDHEDVDLIRDGLLKKDEEMLCTLKEIMGKEVIGDYKFMIKDPHIMKMPDLVLDKIFSKLTPEDRIQCRLVSSRWAGLLPIKKYVKCTSLNILEDIKGYEDGALGLVHVEADFRRLKVQRNPIEGDEDEYIRIPSVSVLMKDLHPLVHASVLDTVEHLHIKGGWRPWPTDLLQVLLKHCHQIKTFSINDTHMEEDHTPYPGPNFDWTKAFISSNIKHLQRLTIRLEIGELDLLNDIQIGDSTSLEALNIELSPRRNFNLRNLESLPPSITTLTLRRLSIPLKKSQITWISNHLLQLITIVVDVHHNHTNNLRRRVKPKPEIEVEDDGDEVDEDAIIHLVTALPRLYDAKLYLGLHSPDRSYFFCEKGREVEARLNENLRESWSLKLDEFCGEEILNITKGRGHFGDDFII